MTFLAPYWLFAASALLIPIAIHLWNKRQGKTVKVGSLRWLEASASQRWSSIKLSNVWLLLLRCLILLLLTVALAQPVWVQQPERQAGQKAVLVSPDLLYSQQLASIKPAIDSLRQRGYTLHAYTSGFDQIQQEQWQTISSTPKDSTVTHTGDYWGLLPALAEKYPNPQDSVWLFTSDLQRHFRGQRTALASNIRWIPVALPQPTTWLQTAVQTPQDSLLLIVGSSSREGTTFSRYRVAPTAQNLRLANGQQMQLQRQGDSLQASVQNRSSKAYLRTSPLQVAIHAEEAQQEEQRYLKAALHAISQYTGQPIQLQQDHPDTTDWVFWLGAEAVPEQLQQQVRQGTKLWVQPGGSPKAVQTKLVTAHKAIPINTVIDTTLSNYTSTLWETTNGEPLLTAQSLGQGMIYHFRSGFSPEWSGLGQSAQLPELLLPLLFPQPKAAAYDARAMDEQQLQPNATPALAPEIPEAQRHSLLPWFVLLAFLLFLTERLVATRQAKV